MTGPRSTQDGGRLVKNTLLASTRRTTANMFGIEVLSEAQHCDKSRAEAQAQRNLTLTNFHGVYDFAHPGGVFEVHLRDGGRFFAPKFPEKSVWKCTNACCADGKTCCQLQIEWGKYGQYALDMDMAAVPPCCSGSVKGNPASWRKVDSCQSAPHITSPSWMPSSSAHVLRSLTDDNEAAFHAAGDEAHGLRMGVRTSRRQIRHRISRRWPQQLCVPATSLARPGTNASPPDIPPLHSCLPPPQSCAICFRRRGRLGASSISNPASQRCTSILASMVSTN